MNSVTERPASDSGVWQTKGLWIIAILFAIVHCLIWLNIEPDIRVQHAGDGTTWYQPAVSLYTHGAFVQLEAPDQGDVYRPPMFPIFGAIMFNIFGEVTPSAIAFGQILLLFAAGCFFRSSVESWLPGWGTFGMALFLFNPNVVTIAQYTQSDTLFLFFVTVALWAVLRFARSEGAWRDALIAGGALACACLTRPTAQFLIVALPLALPLISLTAGRRGRVGRSFIQGGAAAALACLLMAPWAIHVNSVDGRYGLSDSQSRHRFLWDQIIMVEAQSEALSYHQAAKRLEIDPDGKQSQFIAEYGPGWADLNERERYGYLTDRGYGLLLSYPVSDLTIAYVRSIVQFLTAGGTGRLRYILMENPDQLALDWFQTEQGSFVGKLFKNMANMPLVPFMISVICLGFVAVARIAGLVGVFALIDRRLWPLLTVLTALTAYFAFVHLFVGNSRYRVVTEPALMFFMILGIQYLTERWNSR